MFLKPRDDKTPHWRGLGWRANLSGGVRWFSSGSHSRIFSREVKGQVLHDTTHLHGRPFSPSTCGDALAVQAISNLLECATTFADAQVDRITYRLFDSSTSTEERCCASGVSLDHHHSQSGRLIGNREQDVLCENECRRSTFVS